MNRKNKKKVINNNFLEINELIPEKKPEKDEEKVGNKLIKWTPFPIPPKNLIDFSKIETASLRMTPYLSFPVYKKLFFRDIYLQLLLLIFIQQKQ